MENHKKIGILAFIAILLVTTVSAECANSTFIQRVTSSCKLDNNACDDGENIFIDKDCAPTLETFTSGKFLLAMWLVRVLLLVGLVLLIKKSPNFPIIIVALLVLMVLNGAFGSFQTPSLPHGWNVSVSSIKETVSNGTNIEKFFTITPVITALFIIWYIYKMKKKKN